MCFRRLFPCFRLIFISALVCQLGLGAETRPTSDGVAIRVMSFNIRQGVADDGPNHWEKRKPLVVQTIERFTPDLLGTQETYAFQAQYLEQELADYAFFGRSRQKDPHDGEHCGIFYRKDRFAWLAGGHFWLSESPDIPASKSWDSSLPRMASWCLFHDQIAEDRPVLLVNTHFDHRGEQARLESARVIRRRIGELQKVADRPRVIVTGDFNCAEGSAPYRAFLGDNSELFDSFRAVHPDRNGPEGTFNSWNGNSNGGRIDWILATPSLRPVQAEIDRWTFQGRFPSDHFPVMAVFETQ